MPFVLVIGGIEFIYYPVLGIGFPMSIFMKCNDLGYGMILEDMVRDNQGYDNIHNVRVLGELRGGIR